MIEKSLFEQIDDATFEAAKKLSETDGQTILQIVSAGIRSLARLPPGARNVVYTMDESLTDAEINYVMKVAGRSLMSAHRKALMDIYADPVDVELTNRQAHFTEEEIEEIAVKACK